MNTRIIGVYPRLDEYKTVDIFGYASKGLPGLEIIGIGKLGKMMKEKFIYLTRIQRMRVPLRRYVLCVEGIEKNCDTLAEYHAWLELPLLILFWSLTGGLPINKLDDCFSSGRISVTGLITVLDMNWSRFHINGRYKYICPNHFGLPGNLYNLPVELLFEGKKGIFFTSSKAVMEEVD